MKDSKQHQSRSTTQTGAGAAPSRSPDASAIAVTYGSTWRYPYREGEGVMGIADWYQAQQVVEELLRFSQDRLAIGRVDRLEESLAVWARSQFQTLIGRLVYNPTLREDALQEALADLFQGLRTYDPVRAPFEAWAKRVAVHAAYRVVKRHQQRTQPEVFDSQYTTLDEDAPEWEETLEAPDDPEREAIEREQARCLMECARRVLSDDEFLVWVGVLQGNSYEELAALLEKRPDALRQQFKRARAKTLAEAVLHPTLFTNDEIWAAVNECQRSAEPLTERELAAVQEVMGGNPHRQPPSYRNTQHFRDACVKIAPYLARFMSLLAVLVCYSASFGVVVYNSVTQSHPVHYLETEARPSIL